MDIDVSEVDTRILMAALLLPMLLCFGVLGWQATPVVHGRTVLLSPVRWQAVKMAREASREKRQLTEDAHALRSYLSAGRPDPVATMLLAQRIYAHQRNGVSATGPARAALIDAAKVAAAYASGAATRRQALAAANYAFGLIDRLQVGGRKGARKQLFPLVNHE